MSQVCIYYDVNGNRVDDISQNYHDPEGDAQRISEQDIINGRVGFIGSQSIFGRGFSIFFENEPYEIPPSPTQIDLEYANIIDRYNENSIYFIILTDGLRKYSRVELIGNQEIYDDINCYENNNITRYIVTFNRKMLDLHYRARN